MNTPKNSISVGKNFKFGHALTVMSAAGLMLSLPTLSHADDPYSMAPPVQGADSQPYATTASDATASSVFNWQEVPQNQQVPIHRAIFDQGGYQLYDTSGETIVVPFANQNLYVMKFAVSDNNTMYFVNDGGSAPILYVPQNGYLENATVTGARWYPFSEKFHPETPVFVGIAPNWGDYCSMGWYPHMVCYGGFWGDTSIGIFTPTLGLFFNIGGHPYYGWGSYWGYFHSYGAPYRITYNNINIYHYAGRPYWGGRTFGGYTRPFVANRPSGGGYGSPNGGGRVFNGTGHPVNVYNSGYAGNRSGVGYSNGHGTFDYNHPNNTVRTTNGSGSTHTFQGAGIGGSDRTFSNEHSYGRPSETNTVSNSGHVFHGVPSSSGSHSYQEPAAGHSTFSGAGHSYTASQGNSNHGSPSRSFSGGGNFHGGQPSNSGGSFHGAQPSNSGGNGHPSGGGSGGSHGGQPSNSGSGHSDNGGH